MMYENVDTQNCHPPGTFCRQLPHPSGDDRTIEKAVIMEHRFAFFYWLKWTNSLRDNGLLTQSPPTLVTIDWHRDLAPTPDDQKKRLLELDQSNLSDVSNYVWAQFDQTNDGHILCATWLNLVGDVILLKNSAEDMHDVVTDHDGNKHHIHEFRSFDRFQEFMLERDDKNIFFDVDLDYFIHGKGKRYYSEDFKRYSDKEITQVIDPKLPIFQHIFPKIDGITLAQEPGYCGGIVNSCKIMEVIHSQLFGDENNWRHLL
ncbi:hypothetical protein [Fodinibius halophilus]|uniref:Uncharacterized protein n=1 Tax=Fodinibius halophilus TaxID=1736908 RepID=A0A6M1T693_9BACT|nr:hypothetical protein [Fodinibius halophilus]NGP88825.1 hypothetical protein [Fodinibius halophilus]